MELPKPAAFRVEASATITGQAEITVFLIGQPPGQPLQVLGQAIFKGANGQMLVELARQCPVLLARINSQQSGISLAPAGIADKLRQ